MTDEAVFADLQDGRRRFLALVEDVRPDLHRYCARMTGSIIDGEDVVQDTLARAYFELSDLKEPGALRSWLFRIAHNRALDYLGRYERRKREPLEAAADVASDEVSHDDARDREETVRAAVSAFLRLPPAQRSCVILKDVLGYSLEEIAAMLALSTPAIKSALHRGRVQLRELRASASISPQGAVSPALARYAELFNARDWDGVRAMLVDDVKLDLVARMRRTGRRDVSEYFTNYSSIRDWHLRPALLDGREILAVFRDLTHKRPSYFVELTFSDNRVTAIRDFRYVPYIAREAVTLALS